MTIKTNATPLILRALCLHDNDSNAVELKNEFHLLGKKLYENHHIDLVYVNGPLIPVVTTDSTIDENQKYLWWEECNDNSGINDIIEPLSQLALHCSTSEGSQCSDDSIEFSQNSTVAAPHGAHIERPDAEILSNQTSRYNGLDASLMLLRQIWTSCPFWGILGVGKGAAVASLFAAMLESEMLAYHATTTSTDTSDMLHHLPIPPNLPQFIILVSGESLLSENSAQSSSSPFILHLVDFDISPEQELLISQFSQGCQVEKRERIRSTKSKKFSQHDLNIIGRFICQRKKSLYSSDEDDIQPLLNLSNQQSKILALQTALYIAEEDAANCIAETVALNPPSALMAVIRPQMVAGWKGNRRPQPEGGGAPCPEEFLHRKTKNANDPHMK